jgi:sporulation protein YlmC with PRC-barrel domain
LDTYLVYRREGWETRELHDRAVERSATQVEQMCDDVAWIRSYVLDERGGRVGTVCIYRASSPEAIRRHAAAAALPVDEIVKVADTVIVHPDPAPATS